MFDDTKMAKLSGTKSVPQNMQAIYGAIVALTDQVCRDHLDDEYRELAQVMAAALLPQTNQSSLDGAAPDLGLCHRLCVGSDKFPVRHINEAAHDNG